VEAKIKAFQIQKKVLFLRAETVDVAQLVRASDCGSEGRGFKSHLPPQKNPATAGFFITRFFP
jgi:hypothetical protein